MQLKFKTRFAHLLALVAILGLAGSAGAMTYETSRTVESQWTLEDDVTIDTLTLKYASGDNPANWAVNLQGHSLYVTNSLVCGTARQYVTNTVEETTALFSVDERKSGFGKQMTKVVAQGNVKVKLSGKVTSEDGFKGTSQANSGGWELDGLYNTDDSKTMRINKSGQFGTSKLTLKNGTKLRMLKDSYSSDTWTSWGDTEIIGSATIFTEDSNYILGTPSKKLYCDDGSTFTINAQGGEGNGKINYDLSSVTGSIVCTSFWELESSKTEVTKREVSLMTPTGIPNGSLVLADGEIRLALTALPTSSIYEIGSLSTADGASGSDPYLDIRQTANKGQITLEVGGLNKNDTFNGGINNDGTTTATSLALNKVGTGTLTLGGTNDYSGATTISAGTLKLSGVGALTQTSAYTFNGGTLAYDDNALAATEDISSKIKDSTAAITVDTGANEVTWANGLTANNASLVGVTKLGSGTLDLTADNAVSGAVTASAGKLKVTFASKTDAAVPTTGITFSKADGAELDVTMKYTNDDGKTRQAVDLSAHGFPKGTTVNLASPKVNQLQRITGAISQDTFEGTLNFLDAYPQTTSGGFVGSVDNMGSSYIDFGVLGAPDTMGTRIFDIETGAAGRTVNMGAFRFPEEKAAIYVKYRTTLALGALGKESYLNGAFRMNNCQLTVTHDGSGKLKLGSGFRVVQNSDGTSALTGTTAPILTMTSGTLELADGVDLSGFTVTLSNGVKLYGDATSIADSSFATGVTMALPESVDTETGASTGYPLVTVPANVDLTLPDLSSLNTSESLASGTWSVTKSSGNAYILKYTANADAVASVTIGDTTTVYASVEDAVLVAGTTYTVTLLADASWAPAALGTYTFAKNSHTLTVNGATYTESETDGTYTITGRKFYWIATSSADWDDVGAWARTENGAASGSFPTASADMAYITSDAVATLPNTVVMSPIEIAEGKTLTLTSVSGLAYTRGDISGKGQLILSDVRLRQTAYTTHPDDYKNVITISTPVYIPAGKTGSLDIYSGHWYDSNNKKQNDNGYYYCLTGALTGSGTLESSSMGNDNTYSGLHMEGDGSKFEGTIKIYSNTSQNRDSPQILPAATSSNAVWRIYTDGVPNDISDNSSIFRTAHCTNYLGAAWINLVRNTTASYQLFEVGAKDQDSRFYATKGATFGSDNTIRWIAKTATMSMSVPNLNILEICGGGTVDLQTNVSGRVYFTGNGGVLKTSTGVDPSGKLTKSKVDIVFDDEGTSRTWGTQINGNNEAGFVKRGSGTLTLTNGIASTVTTSVEAGYLKVPTGTTLTLGTATYKSATGEKYDTYAYGPFYQVGTTWYARFEDAKEAAAGAQITLAADVADTVELDPGETLVINNPDNHAITVEAKNGLLTAETSGYVTTYSSAQTYNVTIPVTEGVTVDSVVTNNVAIDPNADGSYTVFPDAEVTISFAPVPGYALSSTDSITKTIAGTTAIPSTEVPTAARTDSTFTWTDAKGDHAWTTPSNWKIGKAVATVLPSTLDTVVFPSDGAPWTLKMDATGDVKEVQVNGELQIQGDTPLNRLLALAFTGSGKIVLNGNATIGESTQGTGTSLVISNPIDVSGAATAINSVYSYSATVELSGKLTGTATGNLELVGQTDQRGVKISGDASDFYGTVIVRSCLVKASNGATRNISRITPAGSSSNAVYAISGQGTTAKNEESFSFLAGSSGTYYLGGVEGSINADSTQQGYN